jgi:hypothetical protein
VDSGSEILLPPARDIFPHIIDWAFSHHPLVTLGSNLEQRGRSVYLHVPFKSSSRSALDCLFVH